MSKNFHMLNHIIYDILSFLSEVQLALCISKTKQQNKFLTAIILLLDSFYDAKFLSIAAAKIGRGLTNTELKQRKL